MDVLHTSPRAIAPWTKSPPAHGILVDGAAKYPGRNIGRTFVRRDGIMTPKGPARAAPTNLRKETRDWLIEKTIPTVREIARDLENGGEDVRDLIEAIDELEMILRDGPRRNGFVRLETRGLKCRDPIEPGST